MWGYQVMYKVLFLTIYAQNVFQTKRSTKLTITQGNFGQMREKQPLFEG